jgi:acetyl esterase/lipase
MSYGDPTVSNTLWLDNGGVAASGAFRLYGVSPLIPDTTNASADAYRWSGTSGDVKELEGELGNPGVSSRVQAVLDWFGPTDLSQIVAQTPPNAVLKHDGPNSPEARLLGGPVTEKADLARTANPITYIDRDDPPFLIMHGDADRIVPLGQSVELAKALVDGGVEVTMKTIHGADHEGPQFRSPESQRLVEEFFTAKLKEAK